MRKIEYWKALLFIGSLLAIAFFINVSQNREAPEKSIYKSQFKSESIADPSATQAREPKPVATPQTARILIWPAEVSPTKIIRIPDPESPASGVMDLVLQPGDDYQFEIQPWWMISYEKLPSQIENAADEGDGYKMHEAVQAKHREIEEAGGAWFSKQRTLRFRVKPGVTEQTSFRVVIDKRSAKDFEPLPPVPPERFSNLTVHFRSLQGVNSGVVILLDFQNTSKTDSIGVALRDNGNPFNSITTSQVSIMSSLVSSSGISLSCEDITGLRQMRVNPENLTLIGPGETRHVSLTYWTDGGLRGNRITSFKLQLEIIHNSSYSPAAYSQYQPARDILPPGCKVENIFFEIPVR